MFISPNGLLSNRTAEAFFNLEEPGKGRRIGDIMREAKNTYAGADDNKLRYTLIGNPAMRFPLPAREVTIGSINGIDISGPDDPEELPVLPARGKALLKGGVNDAEGNLDTSFNGIIDITLYDAEKVVQTNGNGADGVVKYFNDRKTLLYRGMARVKDGLWEANVIVPSEIENNNTRARFTFYAHSDEGTEAHGETSRLYVYGFDTEAEEDTEGPEISLFALNRKDFNNGDIVHSSPVVLASMSDPSGINLSDAGIGHKITLILDSKTYYEDVNSYFSPDPDDPAAGSVMYPLPTLEAGKHDLQLTVWDSAGNSSSARLEFEVAVAKAPEIFDLTTDANPARDKVNFTLSTDRPMANVTYLIEVFDLNGRRVWSDTQATSTDILASITSRWDLRDSSGVRVPRGIYLYRATVTSENGSSATRTKKLAVTAQ